VTLAPGQRHAVATGFAIAIPHGYEVQVRPRSGLALKHGITCLNTPGHDRQRLSRRGQGDPRQSRASRSSRSPDPPRRAHRPARAGAGALESYVGLVVLTLADQGDFRSSGQAKARWYASELNFTQE
jgi:hypothetical protein